jgi:hypothetical protein
MRFSITFREDRKIEIARSYSRKVNLGNYETCDFFCSMKAEVPEADAETAGWEMARRCVEIVKHDIAEYTSQGQKP